MKISVLCASIRDPDVTMGALKMLESGRNKIRYIFSDDKQPALGTIWNNMAKSVPAHVYVLVTDRSLCVSPNWDMEIELYYAENSNIIWWNTNAGYVLPIVPHKWFEAAGQLYTDYFPFWFDDTWLKELQVMVYGFPIVSTRSLLHISKRNPMTKRMRDLRFWMDFYITKRPERIEHAAKIREKLGLPDPDMNIINDWIKIEDAFWDKEWKNWENIAGDKSEPDELYIQAKKRAEEFLNVKSN